jgi:hypothetical protein
MYARVKYHRDTPWTPVNMHLKNEGQGDGRGPVQGAVQVGRGRVNSQQVKEGKYGWWTLMKREQGRLLELS